MRFLHLLAAAVWVGGQAALFIAVPVIRERTPDAGAVMGVIGRRFGALAGPALLILLVTGMAQASHFHLWDAREVREKLTILVMVLILTAVHGVLGVRISRGGSPAELDRIRRYSRWISVANLVLGVAAIYLAAALAT